MDEDCGFFDDNGKMISKSDSQNLLKHMTEGVIHKHEVKRVRIAHPCMKCPYVIHPGEPAITITNEVINQYTQRPVFTKPKYYHLDCAPQ